MRKKIAKKNGNTFVEYLMEQYGIGEKCPKNIELKKLLGQRYIIFGTCDASYGWEKNDNELSFFFWEEIPSIEKINAADKIAITFEKKQAFFEISEVAFGGAEDWFLSFVLNIGVSWLAGKGLDSLIKRLKNSDIKNNISIIGKYNEDNQTNGKININIEKIPKKGNVTIEICECSDVISEINEECISDLKNMIENDNNKNYIYSKTGKKFIPGEHNGNISIII